MHYALRITHYRITDLLSWLWRAWRGNRLQATINALIGLIGVVVSLSQVWAVKHAVDVASHAVEGDLYWAVGIMGLLVLANFALNIAGIWVRNILGIKAQNRMQQQLLNRMLRSEWHGKERRHSGDILNRLESDVSNVVGFLTETIPSSLSTLAMFLGAFFYLASMDWRLAVVITLMVPLFLLVSKIYMRRMRQLTREVRESDSQVQSVLQETVQNRMLIKTLESDDMMVDRLESTQSELRHRVVRRTKFSVFSNLILNSGFSLGYLIAFLWAAIRMSEYTLSFGGMTAFLQLVNRIQGPARSLAKLVPAFVSVLTAVERLKELEEEPLEEQGDPILMQSPCGVRLTDVSYAYDDEERGMGNEEREVKVIDHLSFDFRPGTCTAILGETGSGKTTLIRIILALLRPQEGIVEIYDNTHTDTMSPRHRANLVYVPQGNTLMSGTIRENLLLGKPDATDQEMQEALRKSCADFVMSLPQGLDSPCAEQGGGLSEGQIQRIAIARALLRNRPVMLFDEATSALDPDTEAQLLKNILSANDKTIIFITHRPAVVDYCDNVLKIQKQTKS